MYESLIDNIRQGKNETLVEVYYQYKFAFKRYCLKNHAFTNEQDIEIIYHETILSFQKNCLKGRITNLGSAKLFTYLINIAQNHIRTHFNKNNKNFGHRVSNRMVNEIKTPEKKGLSNRALLTKNILQSNLLGELCKELLFLHFYKEYAIEVIKERMGFPTSNAVTKQKTRCLQKLKQSIIEMENKQKQFS